MSNQAERCLRAALDLQIVQISGGKKEHEKKMKGRKQTRKSNKHNFSSALKFLFHN